jgi:RNA polymerase sigma-70 factor, ECF subfamily
VNQPAGDLALRLFAQHGLAVRRYFRRCIHQAATADDLAQEVFLRVVRGRYTPQERERAWLFRIARNVLVDYRRHARRSIEVQKAAEGSMGPAQFVGVDLHRALDDLPEEDREAFLLGEVGGLTYAEIADLTGSTVPSVRSRVYRARLQLRHVLSPPGPLPPAPHPMRGDHD